MNEPQFGLITNLLHKVEIIDLQYEKLKENDNFNIFNLLERKFDEVHLHSRFLYELLQPKGMHGFNTLFLEKLLELLEHKDFNLSNVKVRKEHRNIDILITNDTQAIIIENKLWAADQPAQLQRYYEYISSLGYSEITIYYLSIDGKAAQDHSIGSLKQLPLYEKMIKNISYILEIDKWLEACIKESYAKAPLRETLIQYRLLLKEISGNTMSKEEENEMVQLISQDNNILQAKKIAENWNHVRWHTEWRFWTDLENLITTEYVISDSLKYSDPKLSTNIHQTRNKNPWYGIMFSLGDYLGEDACIFIERGVEDLYYGLTIRRKEANILNNDPKYLPLAELVNTFSEWPNNDYWIGGNYCKPRISFSKFSGEDTLMLLNDKFRMEYLASLWTQIQAFTLQVKDAMVQLAPKEIQS